MRLLITGGSSDIGRAIAARRLKAGDHVTVTCSSAKSLEATLKSYKADGLAASGLVFDLANPSDAESALKRYLADGIDALVLNAASRVTKFRVFHECPDDYFRSYVDENLYGNTWLLKQVLGPMVAKNFGRLVFISSLSAVSGTSRYGAYVTAKAAIEGLFLNLAVDYGMNGITANIVRPGFVATSRTKRFWSNKKYHEGVCGLIPQGHFGQATEIAETLDPLLSPTSYMTGSVLTVSGGLPLLRPQGAVNCVSLHRPKTPFISKGRPRRSPRAWSTTRRSSPGWEPKSEAQWIEHTHGHARPSSRSRLGGLLGSRGQRRPASSSALFPEEKERVRQLVLATISATIRRRRPRRSCSTGSGSRTSAPSTWGLPAQLVTALHATSAFCVSTAQPQLLIASDIRSKFLAKDDLAATALFGDGAAACIVTPESSGASFRYHASQLFSDGRVADIISIQAGGSRLPHSRNTDPANESLKMKKGAVLFLKAAEGMAESASRFLETMGLKTGDIDWLVPHRRISCSSARSRKKSRSRPRRSSRRFSSPATRQGLVWESPFTI